MFEQTVLKIVNQLQNPLKDESFILTGRLIRAFRVYKTHVRSRGRGKHRISKERFIHRLAKTS